MRRMGQRGPLLIIFFVEISRKLSPQSCVCLFLMSHFCGYQDIAAGCLILEEAGGVCSDFDGHQPVSLLSAAAGQQQLKVHEQQKQTAVGVGPRH